MDKRHLAGQQVDFFQESTIPEKNIPCKYTISRSLLLSYLDYHVFYVTQNSKKVSYFGVHPDGQYWLAILSTVNKTHLVCFIEDYIREALGLIPKQI